MKGFVFEGRDKTQRTAHERIAMRNIRGAINWIVGGYYNSLQDGYVEDLPAGREELAEEIYNAAMTDVFGDGYMGCDRAPREMRFAGEKFCRAYIDWKLKQDGDVDEIMQAVRERDGKIEMTYMVKLTNLRGKPAKIPAKAARILLAATYPEEVVSDVMDNGRAFRLRLDDPEEYIWTVDAEGRVPMAGFEGICG